jgi:PAS domain S-box-containing protein
MWRVVIIEDIPEDRDDIRRLLLNGSDRRYQFIEAETGAAGLRCVLDTSNGPPDCVVLDYTLPDMDALEVLAAIVGLDGLTVCPVLVLTGTADARLGPTVLRAGAQDFIGKSWMSAESLTRAVENAVERWAMTRELRARTVALQASEAQLVLGVAVAGLGLTRIDYNTDTVVLDPIAAALFGLAAGVPLPRSAIHATFHPDDKNEIVRRMQQSLDPTGEGSFNMEHRVVHPDGSVHWLSVKKQVMFAETAGTRRPVSSVLAAMDITDRKRDEEKLRQLAADLAEADRRKDEFLATLAHELRNPLAPIRIGLQLMKRAVGQPETIDRTLSMMERQLAQMVRLLDDLLDVSRISRGKLELRKERLLLATVLDSAVETSGPLIGQMGHELTVSLPEQPLTVDADMTRLAQVFLNLLNNAAKYSDRGGHIRLNVELQGADAVVSVKDTGIGIDADQLSKIFEMFTQIDGSLERSQGGLGIGLSLVKRLVDMHGGSVEAKSDGLGMGSEFVVRLPAVIEASQPQALVFEDKSEETKTEGTKSLFRILIVDDNRDGADSLSELLQMMGSDTRTAYDGQQGVDIAGEYRPDVILLDIGLPKLNGFEACRLIREQPKGKDAVIIAMTGWGQEEDRRRSREAGFDHHMVKPVDLQALMKMVSELAVG